MFSWVGPAVISTCAGQRLALEAVGGALRQFRLRACARADVAAGLAARCRTEQVEAALAQLGVAWVAVSRHMAWFIAGARAICASVASTRGGPGRCHALDQARHEVGGGRCDQHQIGPGGWFDVAHRGFRRRVQQIGVHRMAGQRLEGSGA